MVQRRSIGGRLQALAADIKLAHSVFALPFALAATALAAAEVGRWPAWWELLLIVWCMVAARTAAMCVNRYADAAIDARNPRTAGRAIPAGRLTRGFVLAVAALAALGFFAGAAAFWPLADNPWPLWLSPVVLVVLGGYSWAKRFTRWCHVWLGVALALSPLAAALAIEPRYLATPGPWLLAGFVTCWVAGFDVLYALADAEFDRAENLHSMPGRAGVGKALWVSRALHAVAAGLLVAFFFVDRHTGPYTGVATGAVLLLLLVEHVLVLGGKTRRLPLAFFTVNGVISVVYGTAVIVDALR
jgi:4-hydroxybenzoate polyprenyltransferase